MKLRLYGIFWVSDVLHDHIFQKLRLYGFGYKR